MAWFKRKPEEKDKPQESLVRAELSGAEKKMFWQRVDMQLSEDQFLWPFQPEVREAAKKFFAENLSLGLICIVDGNVCKSK